MQAERGWFLGKVIQDWTRFEFDWRHCEPFVLATTYGFWREALGTHTTKQKKDYKHLGCKYYGDILHT